MHYNTTNLKGEQLTLAIDKNVRQEDLILDFFRRRAEYNSYTPSDIWEIFIGKGYNWPITSIRRAVCDLTKQGYLIKLKEKRKGIYGHDNYTWKLKI